jgi:hypothetical protein
MKKEALFINLLPTFRILPLIIYFSAVMMPYWTAVELTFKNPMKSIASSSEGVLKKLLFLTLTGSCASSWAAVTAEDSFETGGAPDYTAGMANLEGQNPTRSGFIGSWTTGFGGDPSVVATGLTYTDGTNNLTAAGGSVDFNFLDANGRVGRLLSNPIDDSSDGTLYFAFLMRLDSTATTDNYRGLELHNGSFNDGGDRKIRIVTGLTTDVSTSGNVTFQMFENNTADFSVDLGAPDTDTNLYVIKFTLGDQSNEDSISIWRNPGDLSSESLSGTPDGVVSNFDLQLDRITFAKFGAEGVGYDELRIGTTWSDVTTVADLSDSDNDGLPDDWEIANMLDEMDDGTIGESAPGEKDGPNGALGDPDIDGSDNLQEFTRGTNPRDPDSDDDEIFDGNETNTEIFVSASNTGTDPLDRDSDDDGLQDNLETGPPSSSDPNKSDTDGDDVNDLSELAAGTDPNSAASRPSTDNADIIGLDYFDYVSGPINDTAGGEYFDYDNSTANDAFIGHIGMGSQSSWFNGANVVCGKLVTQNNDAYRALNGPQSGGEAISRFGRLANAGNERIYFKVEMTYRAGASRAGLSFFTQGTEQIFFGVRANGNFGLEEINGATASGSSPVDGQTYTLVGTIDEDAGADFAKFFLDPNLAAAEPEFGDIEITPSQVENLFPSAILLGSEGDAAIEWDNLVLTTTWEALSTTTPTDSEPDGLRDTFERAFAGDLTTLTSATDNDDSDSLNNADEQTAGTNPLAGDSDGDTLSDSTELANGTNPCLLDTDGDGLNDDWETNDDNFVSATETGTDPLLVDSDLDGLEDGFEVRLGSDPNDLDATPANSPTLLCNGYREDLYGAPLAVQGIETQFGDNFSELNAAYAGVQDGKLFLMLTGNIEGNFNKLNVFIDSSSAIVTNVLTAAGNDGSNVMNGLTFDTGFEPDYHIIVRRGFGIGDQFDLDISNLATGEFASFSNVFGGSQEGFANTGTPDNGTLATNAIGVGYFNLNQAGVLGGTGPADLAAAAAVPTGFEVCIDLADIGSPAGNDIKAMAFVTSSDLTFSSNQFLGTLPEDLDSEGFGTSNLGTTSAIDLSEIAGDQCFTINIPEQEAGISIIDCSISDSTFTLNVGNLSSGSDYHVEFSPDLVSDFADLANSTFTASGETDSTTLTISDTRGFYRVATGVAE